MKEYKFKVGDLVYAKCKTFAPSSWEEFKLNSINCRGVIKFISTFDSTMDVAVMQESIYTFYPEDLIPINCATYYNCSEPAVNNNCIKCATSSTYTFYPEDLIPINCITCYNCSEPAVNNNCIKCATSSTKFISWKPKEENTTLVGIRIKATDQIKYVEEKKTMYKIYTTINAKTLWEADPCDIPAYVTYLSRYGFDDINETTFPGFIEFTKCIDGGIQFLVDRHFIKEVKEEKMMKLKECPFCGEVKDLLEYTIEDLIADKSVRCEYCGALGPPCSTWKQAQLAWNKRVNNE